MNVNKKFAYFCGNFDGLVELMVYYKFKIIFDFSHQVVFLFQAAIFFKQLFSPDPLRHATARVANDSITVLLDNST